MGDGRNWQKVARRGAILVALIGAAVVVNFVVPAILLRFPRIFVQVQPYLVSFGSVLFSALLLFAYLGMINVQERQESIQEAQKDLSERQQRLRELEYRPFFGKKELDVNGDAIELRLANDGRGRAERLALWMDVFINNKHITEFEFEGPEDYDITEKASGVQPVLSPLTREEPEVLVEEAGRQLTPGPGDVEDWIHPDGQEVTFHGRIQFRNNSADPEKSQRPYDFDKLWRVLEQEFYSGEWSSFNKITCRLSLVYHDEFGELHTERLCHVEIPFGFSSNNYSLSRFMWHTNARRRITDEEVLNYIEKFRESPSFKKEMVKQRDETNAMNQDRKARAKDEKEIIEKGLSYLERNENATDEELADYLGVSENSWTVGVINREQKARNQ